MRGPAFFAYANNYLIDVKFGVIVDVEASRAIRQAEVGAAKTMIERTPRTQPMGRRRRSTGSSMRRTSCRTFPSLIRASERMAR